MEENNSNVTENKTVSKKFMIISAWVLTLLGLCYGFVYFVFIYKPIEKQGDEKNYVTCSGNLKYLVDESFDIRENIEISESDATKLYNKINLDKLEKQKDVFSNYSYELEICDIKINYSNEGNALYYKENYYELGNYENDITSLIEKYIGDDELVLFYSLDGSVINHPLTIEDKNTIKSEFEKMDYSEVNVDLAFTRNYLLVVGEYKIYFDDYNGYAEYDGHTIKISSDLLSLLKKQPVENGACCSCCPDLKPGEYCIEACCPCEITKR